MSAVELTHNGRRAASSRRDMSDRRDAGCMPTSVPPAAPSAQMDRAASNIAPFRRPDIFVRVVLCCMSSFARLRHCRPAGHESFARVFRLVRLAV